MVALRSFGAVEVVVLEITRQAAEYQAKHARYVLTPWSAQAGLRPPVIVRGEGRFLYDAEGKRYLDFSAGLVAVNLGHAHPTVVLAMQAQAERLCYAAPAFFHDARAELAETLIKLAPWPEEGRVFFTTGGAEANEDAIKMARLITGRPKVLAAYRSFHGSSLGAITLTGDDRRFAAEPGIPGVIHFLTPYPYRSPFFTEEPQEETRRALDHLELIMLNEDPQRIAAVILEPVVGTNGVIVYPEGYLDGVRRITERHGIILIFDEVMSGFGRIGAPFAAQRFGVSPDMITFAKAVSSAYVPLGGVLIRESLARHFDNNVLWCGHTFSGHPFAVVTALAVQQVYHDEGLHTRALEVEGWLRPALQELHTKHAVVGDARGLGAFFALDLVRDRESREPLVSRYGGNPTLLREFHAALRSRNVYVFGRYNILLIAPPLTIAREEVELGIEALDASLAELMLKVAP
jgi:taurine--2-oxoglutarate transaminase